MDSLGSRLRKYRKSKGIKTVEFATALGLSQGSLSDIELGNRTPASKTLSRIVQCTDISALWLLTGEGEMLRGAASSSECCPAPNIVLASHLSSLPEIALHDYYAVPLIDGAIAAGPGLRIGEDDVRSWVWLYAPALLDRARHDLLAVEVDPRDGHSMSPTLRPGDIVVVDRSEPGGARERFRTGRIYAIRDGEGGCSVKRLYATDWDILILSDNRNYPPLKSWTRNIHELIIGRVVWQWRSLLEA